MHKQVINSHPQNMPQPASVAKVVTMDRSLWAKKSRFKWIFWLTVLFSAALLLSSCHSGQNQPAIHPADTAGLAAFNAQKAADSMAAEQPANEMEREDPQAASQSTAAYNDGPESGDYEAADGAVKSIHDDHSGAYTDDNSAGAVAGGAAEPEAAPVAKKKKFSNAAKGAVIGAGSGAVLGAVISKKNRGLGAVIGAAVGGGAGYSIGKHKDNKKAKSTK